MTNIDYLRQYRQTVIQAYNDSGISSISLREFMAELVEYFEKSENADQYFTLVCGIVFIYNKFK